MDPIRQTLMALLNSMRVGDRDEPPLDQTHLRHLTHDQLVELEIFRDRLDTALRTERRKRNVAYMGGSTA